MDQDSPLNPAPPPSYIPSHLPKVTPAEHCQELEILQGQGRISQGTAERWRGVGEERSTAGKGVGRGECSRWGTGNRCSSSGDKGSVCA